VNGNFIMTNLWKGTSALNSIDQALQTIRNDVVRLDSQLSQLTRTVASNQRQRNQLLNEIAKIRLSEIESGELLDNLTIADKDAAQILDQRELAIQALNQQIELSNQQVEQAESEREQLLVELNATSQKIVDTESVIQDDLKVNKAYLDLLSQAEELESIATESAEKVAQAQEDMAEKTKPYQADELFIYLYRRGFGTTDYNAGAFARFMDSWVAKLIDYEKSRVNFWNLNEIPQRLAQHAERVIAEADTASQAVQDFELNAMDVAGVTVLNEQHALQRKSLDEFDDKLEAIEVSLNEELAQRASFLTGEDEYLQKSLARLTRVIEHDDLRSVHRYVQATVSPTDDQYVIELQAVNDRLEDVEDDLSDVRTLYDKRLVRLKELEGVRRNFKSSRYDDVRSGFGNQALVAGALNQFLQGLVSGSDVWRVIQRNQRYRNVGSMPDFGSGGLGRVDYGDIVDILNGGSSHRPGNRRARRQSTSWSLPTPRRGGGGFKIPTGRRSTRRRSSGGFRTGGGF